MASCYTNGLKQILINLYHDLHRCIKSHFFSCLEFFEGTQQHDGYYELCSKVTDFQLTLREQAHNREKEGKRGGGQGGTGLTGCEQNSPTTHDKAE